MAKFVTIRDPNYARGMNTVDDPKSLADGECVELVNAFPGYPLRPRHGCIGKLTDIEGRVASKVFIYGRGGSSNTDMASYVSVWVGAGGYTAVLMTVEAGD